MMRMAPGPRILPTLFRKAAASCGSKLPMVEPGKKPTRAGASRASFGSSNSLVKSAVTGVTLSLGKSLAQLDRLALDHLAADIDRHVDRKRRRGLEQNARLLVGAGAELDQGRAFRDQLADLGRVRLEDAHLAAGRVVLRQIGDAVEQAASRHRRRNISPECASASRSGRAERRRRTPTLPRSAAADGVNGQGRPSVLLSMTNALLRSEKAGSGAEFGEPHAAELPTRRGIEEVAVAHALVTLRRRQRRAAQHHLIDHEFAVVLAERPFRRAVAWIG